MSTQREGATFPVLLCTGREWVGRKETLGSRALRVLGEKTVRTRYCENLLLDLSSVVHSVQVRGNTVELSMLVLRVTGAAVT